MSYLCKIPWGGFSNDPDGSVRPCCIYRETIKNSNNENYYIQNDLVKDIFHSEYMNNLRNEFIDGKKPKGCETCWIDESNGYKSKRQIYNEILSDKNLNINTNILNDYPIDYQIIISNACNLKCRSCGTAHSTEWQKEMSNLPNIHIEGKNDYIHKLNMPYGQPGNDNSLFISNFREISNHLKRLEIVGGEPFFIKKWEEIIDILIENGNSKNIDFAMSTNGTIFNEELLYKISKNFKSSGIGLSIDGMGEVYNYLRKNGDWEITKGNILKYYQFYLNNKELNVNFNYTCTISWVNAYSIPELHKWFKKNTPEFRIWYNIIHYPPHMSITMIPTEIKKEIEDVWDLCDWGTSKNDINSLINHMYSKDFADEEISRQYENFKYFDFIRKEDTYSIVEKYYPLLKKYFL